MIKIRINQKLRESKFGITPTDTPGFFHVVKNRFNQVEWLKLSEENHYETKVSRLVYDIKLSYDDIIENLKTLQEDIQTYFLDCGVELQSGYVDNTLRFYGRSKERTIC